jgi:hypothetical protein
MEPKVGAETPGNGGSKISGCCDACCTTVEVGTEVLMARTYGHGKDLVAVKAPEKTVAHVREGENLLGR